MRTALTGAVLKVHGTRHSPNQDDSWRSGHRPTRPTVRPNNAVSPAKSKGSWYLCLLCVIENCRQNRKTQVSPELLSGSLIQKCQPRHRVRAVLSERNAIFTRLTCGRPVVSTALQKGFLVRHPHWVYGKTDSRHRKDPRTAELCKCLPANNSRYHHSSYRRRPGNSRRRRGRCNRAP